MPVLDLRSRRPPAKIGLTPLIDVVFILMVFFMLASTFTQEREIDLDARPTAAAPARTPTLLLTVRPDGLRLDGVRTSREEATARLRAAVAGNEAVAVAVKPEGGATLQQAVSAADLARAAGAAHVMLAR